MKHVYVLTREHNEYDQHGEYFEAVFSKQPTLETLAKYFADNNLYVEGVEGNVARAVLFFERLRKGGGRAGTEDVWYNLKKVDFS